MSGIKAGDGTRTRVVFELPTELAQRLSRYAYEHEMTKLAVVTAALEKHLPSTQKEKR